MLQLHGITKRYRRNTVLEAVELALPASSLQVMVGSNGAGKSTLLRIVAQLERPDAGEILLDDHRPRAEEIGYLPQDLRFHPLLTVRKIIDFYARVWRAEQAAAQAALVRWGLEGHREKRTSELSGGLRQRLGLAVLSLRPARLLLLDEPGLSLDPHWRERLAEWLGAMARAGALAIVTTHVLSEWEDRAERILVCENGQVRDLPARSRNALVCQPFAETLQ